MIFFSSSFSDDAGDSKNLRYMDGMEERHSSMREVGAHSSGRWEYVLAIALFGFFFGFFFLLSTGKKNPLFFFFPFFFPLLCSSSLLQHPHTRHVIL